MFNLAKLFNSKDGKPVMVSAILQRDDCSRMLGEFGERHLSDCSKLVIVWKNGSDKPMAMKSNSVCKEEAIGMLITAASFIGDGK